MCSTKRCGRLRVLRTFFRWKREHSKSLRTRNPSWGAQTFEGRRPTTCQIWHSVRGLKRAVELHASQEACNEKEARLYEEQRKRFRRSRAATTRRSPCEG